MQKSKLGLPAGIMAAIMYLAALFGGYTPALLVGGFILLCEEENFIRRAAVKTLLVLVICSLLNVLIYLIPDIVSIFQSMLSIFNVHFGTDFLDNSSAMLNQSLSLIKTLFLVVMAVLALFGKTIDLKPLNKWADK